MSPRAPLLCLVMGLVACGAGGETLLPPPPAPDEVIYGAVKERDRSGQADGQDFTAVVLAQNAFTFRLFGALREAEPERNLAVGGYSVHQVLAMLYAGAAGKTAEQMKAALGWQLPPERLHKAMNALDLELLSRNDDVSLNIANRLWGQRGLAFLPAFLDVLTQHYGAPLAVVDFASAPEQARAQVNRWVRRSTGEKVQELFPPNTIHTETTLVLANALHLEARWKYGFDPAATQKSGFLRDGKPTVQVDMMHYNEFLPSAGTQEWVAVEFPYRGDELSMVVILPQDLERFEARLTVEMLGEIFALIKHGGIHLSMPRFGFSFRAALRPALEAMGLPSLFTDADFSGITGTAGLAVEHFQHEVFVKVDERGTEAAAGSGATLYLSHGPTIAINRPFLFAIRDKLTGALLFLGRVVDPSAQ